MNAIKYVPGYPMATIWGKAAGEWNLHDVTITHRDSLLNCRAKAYDWIKGHHLRVMHSFYGLSKEIYFSQKKFETEECEATEMDSKPWPMVCMNVCMSVCASYQTDHLLTYAELTISPYIFIHNKSTKTHSHAIPGRRITNFSRQQSARPSYLMDFNMQ
jgi:hypothetical protein